MYGAFLAIYEIKPYAYVSSETTGIVWCCAHHHRTAHAAERCMPKAEKYAAELNREQVNA
jgi:hypothetical protein